MRSDAVKMSESIRCERCVSIFGEENTRSNGRVEWLRGGGVRVWTYSRRSSKPVTDLPSLLRAAYGTRLRVPHGPSGTTTILPPTTDDDRTYIDTARRDLDHGRRPMLVLPGDRVELRCSRRHTVVVDREYVLRALRRMGVSV